MMNKGCEYSEVKVFQKEDNLTVKTGASNLFKNTDERDGYTRAT